MTTTLTPYKLSELPPRIFVRRDGYYRLWSETGNWLSETHHSWAQIKPERVAEMLASGEATKA